MKVVCIVMVFITMYCDDIIASDTSLIDGATFTLRDNRYTMLNDDYSDAHSHIQLFLKMVRSKCETDKEKYEPCEYLKGLLLQELIDKHPNFQDKSFRKYLPKKRYYAHFVIRRFLSYKSHHQ